MQQKFNVLREENIDFSELSREFANSMVNPDSAS